MARNVEIKARSLAFVRQHQLAAALADGPAQMLSQRDVFYHVPQGRLKLRFEGPNNGYLVAYSRPDSSGPKVSAYQLHPTDNPDSLDKCLRSSLPLRGEVIKQRTLYLVGQTRVHLDDVIGLGHFLELEVVLREDQTVTEGELIARALMERLEILPEHLLESAYMDMLEQQSRETQE